MIIDAISDLHGHYPKLEGGDLLIVAGDLTHSDSGEDWNDYFNWISKCSDKYEKIVVVAGNHDNEIQKGRIIPASAWNNKSCYLCDSGTEFECTDLYLDNTIVWDRKVKIWGSPWTKRFPGMNPKCMAFTVDTDEELAEKWAMIPEDTDILVTHCPPKGYLDRISNGVQVGSESLFNWWYENKKVRIKLWVFGHIHESYGIVEMNHYYSSGKMKIINASHVNEHYEPVNKPIRVIL